MPWCSSVCLSQRRNRQLPKARYGAKACNFSVTKKFNSLWKKFHCYWLKSVSQFVWQILTSNDESQSQNTNHRFVFCDWLTVRTWILHDWFITCCVCQVTDLVYYKLGKSTFSVYMCNIFPYAYSQSQPMTIDLLPHSQQALCIR